jgi:hypothetical protein
MLAASYASEDMVDQLLHAGADPVARDKQGLGAVDLARGGGREWLGEKIETAGARKRPR